MLTWALVNTVLSLLALGFALLNQGAPHRLRFHVCFIALVCWLVPWSQVPQWLPNLLSLDLGFQLWQAEQQLIASTANATNVPLIIIDTRNVPLVNDVTLLHVPLLILAALLLIGLALFGWHVLQHHLRLRAIQRTARDGSSYWRQCGIDSDVPILLQNQISGAFSSGLLKPVIWVHDDLAATQELPTLLRHELTHIQQHDNWYLLAITLVEKLLWWNPLAWYLGQQSRHLQELSCDERCRDRNADYPAELAQLMLTNLGISRSVAPESSLFSANIFNKPNLNIQRLQVLQRSHQMKPRHIVSAIATAVLAVATVGLVTAQSEPVSREVHVEQERIFIQRVGDAAEVSGDVMFNTAVPPPGAGTQPHFVGLHVAPQEGDQMMRVHIGNGEERVTLSFNDAPLSLALTPLAHLLTGPGMPPLPAGAVMAETFELGADGQAAPRPVVRALVRSGAGMQAAGVSMPTPANLVLEDDSAKARKVTVSITDMSLADALDAIAEASGCNIFKDGDNIVVDYCEAQ